MKQLLLLENSSIVARRVRGGIAGRPCAHAQGYEAHCFFFVCSEPNWQQLASSALALPPGQCAAAIISEPAA
jgi:hypothetical protein